MLGVSFSYQQKQKNSDHLVAYRHMLELELVILDGKGQCLYFGTGLAHPEARKREGCHICHYLSQYESVGFKVWLLYFQRYLFRLVRSHV